MMIGRHASRLNGHGEKLAILERRPQRTREQGSLPHVHGTARYWCFFLVGFVGAAQSASYVDAADYPSRAQGWSRFHDLEDRMIADFGHMCLDGFCRGRYRRIQPLRFRCSVDSDTGIMGECVWVLAASEQTVDPSSGEVAVNAPVWRCRAPLAKETLVEDFYRALHAGGGAIHASLPKTDRSIYDGLRDCVPWRPE